MFSEGKAPGCVTYAIGSSFRLTEAKSLTPDEWKRTGKKHGDIDIRLFRERDNRPEGFGLQMPLTEPQMRESSYRGPEDVPRVDAFRGGASYRLSITADLLANSVSTTSSLRSTQTAITEVGTGDVEAPCRRPLQGSG